jgi:FkbH-like protein
LKARLLSNVTMQPLALSLRPWDVSVGEYDSLLFELNDPASLSAGSGISHVLCIFDTDALIGEARFSGAAPDRAFSFIETLDRFSEHHSEKVVVVNSFCASTERTHYFDVTTGSAPRSVEAHLNDLLTGVARKRRNLLLIDIEQIYRRFGEDRLHSPAFWYIGRIRYTSLMFSELAKLIHQALAAYDNQARKVLVLDLDNTLWGGIVGETGPHGVVLGEDGAGRAYKDFQRAIKSLRDTGVLLAVCSKNNAADVDEIFDENPEMVLSRETFVAMRVNWNSKPENIIDIASALNLGLESFVFVDDNSAERALVSEALPEVAVPCFPQKPELLPRWFTDEVVRPYFGRYRMTIEDLNKTEQYQANEARRQFATQMSLETFLEQLNIVCTIEVDGERSIERAAQMTQKTNQFNLTTRRCDITEVTSYVQRPDRALIVLDYADRFGPEGIVGLAMLDLSGARITNFLLSCRVVGRKVEDRLLDRCLEWFRDRGVSKVFGEFIPTRKNEMVSNFYPQHHFDLNDEKIDGSRTYERTIQ